jgi:hypothetical protein
MTKFFQKKGITCMLILMVATFTSCSLHNYSNTQRIEDNTITINSNTSKIILQNQNSNQNLSPSSILDIKNQGIQMPYYRKVNNQIKYSFVSANTTENQLQYSYRIKVNSLKNSNLKFTILGENRESKELFIKKEVRKDALLKDILCLGVPLIVDPLLPTFYKIANASKISNIELSYTNEYMNAVFLKIKKSTSFDTFNHYIFHFPKSELIENAIFLRDSLLLIEILKDKKINIFNEFIQAIQQSPFEKAARAIFNKEIESSKYLDSIGQNKTIANLELYIKRYPGTFNFDKVVEDLLIKGEQETYAKNSIQHLIYYKKNIFDKYHEQIFFNFQKPGPLRNNEITSTLERLAIHLGELIKKSISTNTKLNEFEKNKLLLNSYTKYCDSLVINAKGEFVVADIFEEVKNNTNIFAEICNHYFIKLQKTNESKELQKKLLEEIVKEIPSFKKDKDIISTILICARKKNGKLKLWNSNDFPYIYKENAVHYNCSKNLYHLNWKNTEYETENLQFDTFDNLILNFKDGKLSGAQEYYYNGVKFYEADFLDGYNIKMQNYYVRNELKTSKLYNFNNINGNENSLCNSNNLTERNCVYYFKGGKNTILEALDVKISYGIDHINNGEYARALNLFEFLARNNYPIDCEQNIKINKYYKLAFEKQNELLESLTTGKYDDQIKAIGQMVINYTLYGYSSDRVEKEIVDQMNQLSSKIGHKFSKSEEDYFFEKINSQLAAYTGFLKLLNNTSKTNKGNSSNSNNKSNSSESNLCRICNGSGKINCRSCNGTTEIACKMCWMYPREICKKCNGRKRENCTDCSSSDKGREKCNSCFGTGYSNR